VQNDPGRGKEDLEEEGIASSQAAGGTMIEVPAAAVMAEFLARELNFFSSAPMT